MFIAFELSTSINIWTLIDLNDEEIKVFIENHVEAKHFEKTDFARAKFLNLKNK